MKPFSTHLRAFVCGDRFDPDLANTVVATMQDRHAPDAVATSETLVQADVGTLLLCMDVPPAREVLFTIAHTWHGYRVGRQALVALGVSDMMSQQLAARPDRVPSCHMAELLRHREYATAEVVLSVASERCDASMGFLVDVVQSLAARDRMRAAETGVADGGVSPIVDGTGDAAAKHVGVHCFHEVVAAIDADSATFFHAYLSLSQSAPHNGMARAVVCHVMQRHIEDTLDPWLLPAASEFHVIGDRADEQTRASCSDDADDDGDGDGDSHAVMEADWVHIANALTASVDDDDDDGVS